MLQYNIPGVCIDSKDVVNEENEKNGEQRNSKPRIIRNTQHGTNLTPLLEGSSADHTD